MVSSFWCLPFGCSSVCGGISHRKMVLLLLIMEIAATLCDSSALKNNCIVYSLSQGSFVENEDADEEEKKQNNKIPTMYLKEDLRKIPDTIVNNNNGGLCRVLIPYGNILVLSDDMLIPYPLLGAWIQKHTLPLLGLFLLGLNLHVLGFASIIFDAIPYYNAYHYVGGILIIVVLLLLSAPLRRSYLLHLIGYVDFWLITLYGCVSYSVYLSIQQRYRGNEFDAYLYLPLALNGALMGSFFVGLDSSTYSLRFRKWGMIGLIMCMLFCALATFSFVLRAVCPQRIQEIFFEPVDMFLFTTTRQTLFSTGCFISIPFMMKAAFRVLVRKNEFYLLHVPVRQIVVDLNRTGTRQRQQHDDVMVEPPQVKELEMMDA